MLSRTVTIAGLAGLLAACGGAGVTTDEVEAAAQERARSEMGLAASTELRTEVWTGGEWDGDLVVCGTVAGQGEQLASGSKRFAAKTEPLTFLIFEDLDNPIINTGGDEVPDWIALCGNRQG